MKPRNFLVFLLTATYIFATGVTGFYASKRPTNDAESVLRALREWDGTQAKPTPNFPNSWSPPPHFFNLPNFPDIPDLSDLNSKQSECEKTIPDFLGCPKSDIVSAVQATIKSSNQGQFGTAVQCQCKNNNKLIVSMSCGKSGKWEYIGGTTCDSSLWSVPFTLGTVMIIVALIFSVVLNITLMLKIRQVSKNKILRILNIQMPTRGRGDSNPPPYEQMPQSGTA